MFGSSSITWIDDDDGENNVFAKIDGVNKNSSKRPEDVDVSDGATVVITDVGNHNSVLWPLENQFFDGTVNGLFLCRADVVAVWLLHKFVQVSWLYCILSM